MAKKKAGSRKKSTSKKKASVKKKASSKKKVVAKKAGAKSVEFDASEIEMIPVDEMYPRLTNYNEHSDEQIDEIVRSLNRFAMVAPVLIDEDNIIIHGHGTWEAVKRSDRDACPCVRATHLTDDEKEELQITLNDLPRWATPNHEMYMRSIQRVQGGDDDYRIVGIAPERMGAIMESAEWGNIAQPAPKAREDGGRQNTSGADANMRTITITVPNEIEDAVMAALSSSLEFFDGVIFG